MKPDLVQKIANSILYEGYMLYPYRRSSLKNQHRWNFGVTGGVGIAQDFGKNRIFFDARFEYGLVNIQKYSEDGKNNTGNVLLSLGYAYRL